MFPNVLAILAAAPDVTAIIGTDPTRVWKNKVPPDRRTAPYVTWFLVVGTPELMLSAPPKVDRQSIKFDVWAVTQAQATALATACRDALEEVVNVTAFLIDEEERETKLWRIAFQATFWGR